MCLQVISYQEQGHSRAGGAGPAGIGEIKMKFYLMGNGKLIAEANRGISKKQVAGLQRQPWAISQGGICQIVEYNEERAIYFVNK